MALSKMSFKLYFFKKYFKFQWQKIKKFEWLRDKIIFLYDKLMREASKNTLLISRVLERDTLNVRVKFGS